MSNLAFYAADTLGVTLYNLAGTIKGLQARQIKFGPFKIDVSVNVVSDVITGVHATFWVTIAGVPMYLVQHEKKSLLVVLDKTVLKQRGEETGFQSLTLQNRWLEIKPAIKMIYGWDEDSTVWKPVLSDTVKFPAGVH